MKTLQNYIKSIETPKPLKLNLKEIILLIDVTYWGLNFGVVVFKDAISKKFIWWNFIEHKEKIKDYVLGFLWYLEQGYVIKVVVAADGFKGLTKILYPIPFQICQIHIQRNIQTKLIKKPKSLVSKELLELSRKLTKLNKESFVKELENWQEKHKDFLNEKSINDSGRLIYAHQRLRSAYYSLKRNLAYLYYILEHKILTKLQ